MFAPARHDVVVEIVCVDLLGGRSEARQLDALVVGDELFDVYGSKGRSLVDVDPELRYGLFCVLSLRKLDHCADELLFIDTAAILLGVVAEYPCIGQAFALEQAQGTSLITSRFHTDLLLRKRTDGLRRVYCECVRKFSGGHAASR